MIETRDAAIARDELVLNGVLDAAFTADAVMQRFTMLVSAAEAEGT